MNFQGSSSLKPEWFWENYSNCFKWIERQKYAYWKSIASRLNYERDALLSLIQDRATFDKHERYTMDRNDYPSRLYTRDLSTQYSEVQARKRRLERTSRNVEEYKIRTPYHREIDRNYVQESRHESSDESERDDSSISSDDLDEDVVEFFKKTMKHQMERRKINEAAAKCSSSIDSLGTEQENYLKSPMEMRMIYGENAPKIQGMETAMQLSFERKCAKYNPVLWPGLPLKF